MACPYDLYLRFLVTKGMTDTKEVLDHLKEVAISRTLHDADFDAQYDLVLKSVTKPVAEQIESQNFDGDFLKWARILEVPDLWKTEKRFLDPELRKRWNLILGSLDDPHLVLAINALLIKNVPLPDVADLISMRFSAALKEPHLELYRKFVFDPRRMTRKDWKAFLKDKEAKEKHIYFTALTESVDTLKTELELPADINVSFPLAFLLSKSFQKAKTYLEMQTPEAGREARAWIGQVTALTDKYEKYRTGDKADFAKQLQMQFDFIDNEFPTPDAGTMALLQEELGLDTAKK